MDGHNLVLLLYVAVLLYCPISLLSLQERGFTGVVTGQVGGGTQKQLSGGSQMHQFRQLQGVEPKGEKEEESRKNRPKEDAALPPPESKSTPNGNSPADTGHDSASQDNQDSQSNITSNIASPPTSIDVETPAVANKTVPDSDADNQRPSINCEGSHCQDPKKMVSACLSIPGDGIHELSLFITYEGEGSVMIKILAPEFLTANPVEVSVSKGRSETVHFSIDFTHEDALSNIEGIQNKFINITSMHGNCTVAVPIEYLINSMRDTRPQFSSILPVMEPKILVYGFAFVIVLSFLGAWLCFKCRGQRQGEVKYQQLEMNGLDTGTPKESMEQRSGSADGWDEVWDDDWEDSEAAKSSSHLSQSVSSRGLAARRGVKDGWETSWDD